MQQALPARGPIAAAVVFAMAATALLAVHSARAQAPAPKPTVPATAPGAAAPDPTKELFETACSNCHDLSVVTGQRKTPADWGTTMDNMLAHGAPITEEQANQILEYLGKHYSDKN